MSAEVDDLELAPKRGPGAPRIEMDYDTIERAASIGCTKEEIAAMIGVARSTLYLHMETDPAIQAAIDRGSDHGKAALRRMQWNGAKDGNATMLVWLGKQLLGQKDRSEMTGADGAPLIGGITVTFVRPKDSGVE